MKVLFNLLDSGVGGGQEVAFGLAGELRRHGHGVGVVVPQPGPATERFGELGAQTHLAALVSLRRPGVVHGARIAREYDLVYSHTSVPGEILGGIAAELARRPHVVHRHVYPHFSPHAPLRVVQRGLYRVIVGREHVAAVAAHVADALAELGFPRDRIEVISNGVVIPDDPAPPREEASPVRVGLLARLDPQKGVDVFVQMARLLGPEAELVLGTPGPGSRYGEEMVAAARAAGVSVVMPPDSGTGFLRSVDVVVLPSRYEGHPLVLLEAMALGKAIVATDIAGIREVVEPEAAAVLVPPEDAQALAAAVGALVEDGRRRVELGAKARRVAANQYALPAVLERTIAFLERVAAMGR